MMRQEFNAIMRPFLEMFGENNYPTPKLQLVWGAVHDLSPSQFRRVVETLIGENKPEYPPKVSLFREFAETERKKSIDAAAREAAAHPVVQNLLVEYPTDDAAIRSVDSYYTAMIVNAPKVPEWVRREFNSIAVVNYEQLAGEVDWLRGLVKNGKADHVIRAEYVQKAKQLILNITTRAVFQAGLLKRQSPPAKGDA
jgi:hypothetical protein